LNYPWKQIRPKDTFFVKKATPITSEHLKVLSFLYQPIIGIDAYSFYQTLLTYIEEWEFDSEEIFHADLLNQLDIDIPRFFKGRVRLEGIGLLQVYVKELPDRKQFIYEVCPPSLAADFFKDDVLSILLLEKVGERRFKRLVQRFAIPPVDTKEYQNVTKKFLDVYPLQTDYLTSQQPILDETSDKFTLDTSKPISVISDTFDWSYFIDILNGLLVNKDQITKELQEGIYLFHRLYGIDEVEMKELVEGAVDLATGQVALKDFRREVLIKYRESNKTVQQPQAEVSNPKTREQRQTELKEQGFSDIEIAIILSSEEFPPMQYLQSIRTQTKGFITQNEKWLVENLVKESGLPNSVLNILIHFVLVVKQKATLSQQYVLTIANNWAQSDIRTPEAAMKKVKEVSKKASSKSSSSPTYNNRRGASKRVETLPDWATQVEPRQETPLSEEQRQQLQKELQQLRQPGTNTLGGDN